MNAIEQEGEGGGGEGSGVSLKMNGVGVRNVTLSGGSVIEIEDSTTGERNGVEVDVEIVGSRFEQIEEKSGKPSVLCSRGSGRGVHVGFDGGAMVKCESSKSEEGGAVWMEVGDGGSSLEVKNMKLSFCEASIGDGGSESEKVGRGGWLYFRSVKELTGEEANLVPLLLKDVKFIQNNASVGRDVFIKCSEIKEEIDDSLFQFDMREGEFMRDNALYGCGVDGVDVDLLDMSEIYQSETVFVSSEKWDSTRQCGSLGKACKTIVEGLKHIVEGFEKRIIIVDSVTVGESFELVGVSLKGTTPEGSKVEMESEISDGSREYEEGGPNRNSIIETKGAVTFEQLLFELPRTFTSEHRAVIRTEGRLSVLSCSFSPFKVAGGKNEGSECRMGFPLLVVKECVADLLKVSISAITLSGVSSLISIDSSPSSESATTLSIILSAFDVISRETPGATVLESTASSLSVSFNQVNCTSCSSVSEKGSVISLESSISHSMRDCTFSGVEGRREEGVEICSWNGFLIHLVDCEARLELVTIGNSSKGGLSVEGGKIAIVEGKFEGNDPGFKKYPSFRRNIICSSTEKGDGLLNVSSLKGGDGVLPNPSLWIQPTSTCKLGGIALERVSTFFVPTLTNVSVENGKEDGDSIVCEGTLLLPCNTSLLVVGVDSQGKFRRSESVPLREHVDEKKAIGRVEKGFVDGFVDEESVEVGVEFGDGRRKEKCSTERIVVRERKVGEVIGPIVEGRIGSGGNVLLVLVCVLTGIVIACGVVFVVQGVVVWREKRKRGEPQQFVKDVEMGPIGGGTGRLLGERESVIRQQELEPLTFYSNEEAKSTDALLESKSATMDFCVEDRKKEEEKKGSVEIWKPESRDEGATALDVKGSEPVPTTSSIDNLVEGMCCECPYEKVIVDVRDSLFERLHHSKDPFEKRMRVEGRELGACRTLYWVANGAEHIVEERERLDLLRDLSSYSVMFGEEGVVCLGPVGGARRKKGGEGGGKDGNGMKDGLCLKKEEERGGYYETDRWKAPEVLQGDRRSVSEASVVFALGMLLYEMVSGHVPFEGVDVITAGLKIVNGERPSLCEIRNETLRKLVRVCVSPNPCDRPYLGELKGVLLSELPEGSGGMGKKEVGREIWIVDGDEGEGTGMGTNEAQLGMIEKKVKEIKGVAIGDWKLEMEERLREEVQKRETGQTSIKLQKTEGKGHEGEAANSREEVKKKENVNDSDRKVEKKKDTKKKKNLARATSYSQGHVSNASTGRSFFEKSVPKISVKTRLLKGQQMFISDSAFSTISRQLQT